MLISLMYLSMANIAIVLKGSANIIPFFMELSIKNSLHKFYIQINSFNNYFSDIVNGHLKLLYLTKKW